MKYKGVDSGMWDAWYMNVNGRVHGFHLQQVTGREGNVGHVYTDDLLHFHACEDILPPLGAEKNPEDCLGKYTGCAYYDEEAGKAYVYYTMRNRRAAEKIGVAISEDLVDFPLYEHNPVLTVDPAVLMTESRLAGGADCRDMLVIKNPEDGRYCGYFASVADVEGRGPVGVIAAAVSDDLLTWTDQRLVYVPPFDGTVEVPDVFYLDGKWYLTVLTGHIYGAKGGIKDPNPVRYTLCASADNPFGPFVDEEDNLLLCGGYESGFSCRSVEWNGTRYGLYIDRSWDGYAISLPKELRVVNGSLKMCYAPIVQQLRVGEAFVPTAETFEPQRTSFAWHTYGGQMDKTDSGVEVSVRPHTYQRYVCEAFSAPSLELEMTVRGNCRECGAVMVTFDDQGGQKESYVFSLDLEQQEVTVYLDKYLRNEYTLHSKRQYPLNADTAYRLRVIAAEGQFEVYVDDVLALQGDMCTNHSIKGGLFCAMGNAEFKDIRYYELEK